jgi:lincosamide nucleotidyltransferase A/C/D/E
MTNEQDIVDFLKAIEAAGVTAWIGGGWGVDALVGYQTRPHDDIDIYIDRKNADKIIQMLISREYGEVKMEYITETHKVWRDPFDRTVDLHLLEFQEESIYFEGFTFAVDVLNGEGTIGGIAVRCFTAEAQLLFHQGYEHSEKDEQDVLLLCKTFGFDIPIDYKRGEAL